MYWLVYCILGLDLQFFEFKHTKYRLVFLCLLIFLAIVLVRLFRRVFVEKDTFSRRFLLYTGINLAILSVFLLLLWPGTWSWDDVNVLNGTTTYFLSGWQHFFSSLAIIFSAYLLPSVGGIVFVQTVIIAFISGYVLALFETYFLDCSNRFHKLALIIADLVFFLPPILIYDYSKFRSTLCSYLEILLFTLVLRFVKDTNFRNAKNYLFFFILLVLLASWRSENIYYAPFCFFFFLFILGVRRWKSCLAIALAACIIVIGIGKYNTSLVGNSDYSVMAVINQATVLARKAASDSSENNSEALERISRVLDLDRVLTEADKDGSTLYWQGATLEYSEQDYNEFLKACVTLTIKYPLTFLQERFEMFWDSLGFNDKQSILSDSAIKIYQPGNSYSDAWGTDRPALNVQLRESTIRFLSGLTADNSRTLFYHLFWNLAPPIIVSILFVLVCLIKKKFLLFFLAFSCLCKLPIIFLTAPAPYFMYYLSIYLFGYLIFFFTLALLFNRKCKRKEPMVS